MENEALDLECNLREMGVDQQFSILGEKTPLLEMLLVDRTHHKVHAQKHQKLKTPFMEGQKILVQARIHVFPLQVGAVLTGPMTLLEAMVTSANTSTLAYLAADTVMIAWMH